MTRLNVSILLGLCVVLLPAVASAGSGGTGACLIEVPGPGATSFPAGKDDIAVCVDGLSEDVCLKGTGGEGEWFEGLTCGELDVPWEWEGSCQADVDPFGDQCYVLWADGDAELVCVENAGGTWFEDLECGIPVPAMPGFGMAVMALLILGGALVLLTIRGSLPSA